MLKNGEKEVEIDLHSTIIAKRIKKFFTHCLLDHSEGFLGVRVQDLWGKIGGKRGKFRGEKGCFLSTKSLKKGGNLRNTAHNSIHENFLFSQNLEEV